MLSKDERRSAFLAVIRANPDDDHVRLEFARWLQGQGDSLGEFIRLQYKDEDLGRYDAVPMDDTPWSARDRKRISPTILRGHDSGRQWTRREAELFRSHGADWFGHPPCEIVVFFHRGFPTVQICLRDLAAANAFDWFLSQRDWIFDLHIDGDHFLSEEPLLDVLELGLLDKLVSLSLDGCRLSDVGLCKLAGLSTLRQLTIQVDQFDPALTGAGLRGLTIASGLRELRLKWLNFCPQLLRNLSYLTQLTSLELDGCEVPPVGKGSPDLPASANENPLPDLRILSIKSCDDLDGVLGCFADVRNLRELYIQRSMEFHETHWAYIASLTNLEVLELDHVSILDRDLHWIKQLRKLSTLVMKRKREAEREYELTDAGLQHVRELRELRHLTVRSSGITNAGLASLEGLTNLQTLDLQGTRVTCGGLSTLKRHTQLRELKLNEKVESDEDLLELAELLSDDSRTHLASLVQPYALCTGKTVTEKSFSQIGGISRLQELDVSSSIEFGEGFEHLIDLKGLRALELMVTLNPNREKPLMRGPVIESLAPLAELRKLRLGNVQLTASAFTSLQTLLQQRTDLPVDIEFHGTGMTDSDLEFLARLPQVCNLSLVLDLSDSQVTEAGFRCIENWSSLSVLSLPDDLPLTDTLMSSLSELTGLQELDVRTQGLSDRHLEQLAKLTNLQVLDADHNEVTDAGLKYLAGMKGLRHLDLYRPAGVTDAGLVHLSGLTELRYLNLAYSAITDAGLEQLSSLTQLHELLLGDAPVTGEGITRLKLSLQDCWVTHQDYTSP